MTNYNYKTKKWEKLKIITNADIEKIVGRVRISIDSLGNIEINKTLSADEKQKIEKL